MIQIIQDNIYVYAYYTGRYYYITPVKLIAYTLDRHLVVPDTVFDKKSSDRCHDLLRKWPEVFSVVTTHSICNLLLGL